MSGLQEAFYIVGIIFMGIMLVLIAALVVSVFVIKAKINKIHDNIESKINLISNLAEKGGGLAALAAGGAVRKARKALKHKK